MVLTFLKILPLRNEMSIGVLHLILIYKKALFSHLLAQQCHLLEEEETYGWDWGMG